MGKKEQNTSEALKKTGFCNQVPNISFGMLFIHSKQDLANLRPQHANWSALTAVLKRHKSLKPVLDYVLIFMLIGRFKRTLPQYTLNPV